MALAIALVIIVNSVAAGVKDAQASVLAVGLRRRHRHHHHRGRRGARADGQAARPAVRLRRATAPPPTARPRSASPASRPAAAPRPSTPPPLGTVHAGSTASQRRGGRALADQHDLRRRSCPTSRRRRATRLPGAGGTDGTGRPHGGPDGAGGSAFNVDSFTVLGSTPRQTPLGPLTAVDLTDGRTLDRRRRRHGRRVLDSAYATTAELAVGDTFDIGGHRLHRRRHRRLDVGGRVRPPRTSTSRSTSHRASPASTGRSPASTCRPHPPTRSTRSRPTSRPRCPTTRSAPRPTSPRPSPARCPRASNLVSQPRHLAVDPRARRRVPGRDPVHHLGRHPPHPRVRHPQGARLEQPPHRRPGRRRVPRAGAHRRRRSVSPSASSGILVVNLDRPDPRRGSTAVRRQARRRCPAAARAAAGFGGRRSAAATDRRRRCRLPVTCRDHRRSRSASPCSAGCSPARSAAGAPPACARPTRLRASVD